MKSSIIENILNVEEKAEKIISDAEKEGRDIVYEAHEKAQKIIKDSIDSAKKEGDALVSEREEILKKSLEDYEREKKRIEEEGVALNNDAIESASERIVSLLLKSGV